MFFSSQLRAGHLAGEALADGLDDGVVFDVVGVVGLELNGDAGQGSLESLLGGSVDHLGLYRMSVEWGREKQGRGSPGWRKRGGRIEALRRT